MDGLYFMHLCIQLTVSYFLCWSSSWKRDSFGYPFISFDFVWQNKINSWWKSVILPGYVTQYARNMWQMLTNSIFDFSAKSINTLKYRIALQLCSDTLFLRFFEYGKRFKMELKLNLSWCIESLHITRGSFGRYSFFFPSCDFNLRENPWWDTVSVTKQHSLIT